MEFVKVQPENFALELQYLDNHWMRVRAEAKRRGAVLDYHLISNAGIVTPGHKVWDQDSIVLLTKYKNMDAFMESQHTPYAQFLLGGDHATARATGVPSISGSAFAFKLGGGTYIRLTPHVSFRALVRALLHPILAT